MDDRVRVPVLSKLSLAPDKGWNIGVSGTTTVNEILTIVSRALKCDPNTASMFATIPGKETQMDPNEIVLETYKAWQKIGLQGRFIIRDKPVETTTGADLFQLINSSRPVFSVGAPARPRGINTNNTFSLGASASTGSFTPQFERNGHVLSPNLPRTIDRNHSDNTVIQKRVEESRTNQNLTSIDETIRNMKEKKEKILALLSDYSKKLATPLDNETMKHYQETIRKANLGLSAIEQKLNSLECEKQKLNGRKRSSIPIGRKSSAQEILQLPNGGSFKADSAIESQIVLPEQMRAQFSSAGGSCGFSQILSLLQRSTVTATQEKALRLIGNLCQIPANQLLLLRTNLLLILFALIRAAASEPTIIKLSCWLLACLSSHESNKELIVKANGFSFILPLLMDDSGIAEQAFTVVTNIVNSRNFELHKSFRAAGGLGIVTDVLCTGNSIHKTNVLRVIILLGLPGEDKTFLVSKESILLSILNLVSSSDPTATKLSVMILSGLSSVPEARSVIRKHEKGFSQLLLLLAGNDTRLVEKTVLLINNLSLSEEGLAEAIPPLIPLMNHSESKLRSKAIRCLSNLVLIDEDHLESFYESEKSIESVIQLLQTDDVSILAPAVRVLVNITHSSSFSDSIRTELGQCEVIQHLVQILRSQFAKTPEIQEQALKALVNISLTYLNEDDYLSTKIVGLLANILAAPNSEECELAVATIVNITRRSDKIRERVRQTNALETILSLCKSPIVPIQSHACKAITNLALNGRNRYFLQQSECKNLFEGLKNSENAELADAATNALRNLAFPCEDYSNAQDDLDLSESNANMEEMIKQAALEVEEQEQTVSKDDALVNVSLRNLTLQRCQTDLHGDDDDDDNSEDKFDDFLSELVAEELKHKKLEKPQNHQENVSLSPVKNDPIRKISLDLSSVDSSSSLSEMEDMATEKTPRTLAKLLREENEKMIAEQRKLLEEERKKFEEERKKFEEERIQMQNKPKATTGGEKKKDFSSPSPSTPGDSENNNEPPMDPAKLEKYNNRRMKIAVEILVTERSYVDSLNTMVNKYMNPMHGLSLARRPVIKNAQVTEIFANVEEIINYHTMLLEGLERRVAKFAPTTCLGEFFISMTDYLRCYTTYVNNYNNAISILTELEESSGDFEAKLKHLTDSGMKGKSLYTYLIMPIQRVPRYILLLNELIKHTRSSHPDYDHLKEAATAMERLADYIDESKEAYNENRFVVELQKRIKGFPKEQTLVAPNRTLVKNAPLIMNQSDYWVFLFSDILMQTIPIDSQKKKKKKEEKEWPHYQFVRLISLKGVELFDYPDSKVAPNAFSLRGKDYSFNCSTDTKEEKIYWICALKETIVET